jgi:hypothetical protein
LADLLATATRRSTRAIAVSILTALATDRVHRGSTCGIRDRTFFAARSARDARGTTRRVIRVDAFTGNAEPSLAEFAFVHVAVAVVVEAIANLVTRWERVQAGTVPATHPRTFTWQAPSPQI